jgi:hypothetical protein
VRGYYSEDTHAVRTHRYASEGRADDANVSGAAVDIHEPAGAVVEIDGIIAIGLHTTRRAKLASAPTNGTRRYASAL